MQHAIGHGMYIHPLYLVNGASGNAKGVSVGTDTNSILFDLPEILINQVKRWIRVLLATLKKDGMFPMDS